MAFLRARRGGAWPLLMASACIPGLMCIGLAGCGTTTEPPGLQAQGEPALCVNHSKTLRFLSGSDYKLGISATVDPSTAQSRRASVVNTYLDDYGGCNATTTVNDGNSQLSVYFNPGNPNVTQQQRDTFEYLKRSGIFSSIQQSKVG
jgi:hypothetical protein